MHRLVAMVVASIALWGGRAEAQEPDSVEIARLKEQIEAITREIERLKLGDEVVARADTAMLGLGPAASKVEGPGGRSWVARCEAEAPLAAGDMVGVRLDLERVLLFGGAGDPRLAPVQA